MDEDTRVKTRIPVPRKGILKGHIPLRGSDLGLADSDAEGQGFSEDESSYYPAPGSHISHQPTAAQQRTGRITGRAKHTHQHPHGPSPGSIDGRRRQSESGSRRHGSASTSGTRPSQIPKLTVSWWETNSVAGEAPHDAQSESDDTSSVQSFGSHSSSVISQNWPGKSTRFVPHCQKRGHSHSHEDPGEYLTPTQRKNRVIAELRKQLRNAVKSVEEKEKHIDQLRERMAELESVLDQGGFLSENHRLLTKLKMNAEAHRREREQLAARYEARLRKLRKAMPSETDCTGPDWGAEAALIVGLEKEASNIDYDSEAHRREREQLAARYEARLRKLRKAMPSETDCTGPDWGAEAALIVGLEKEASNIDYDSGKYCLTV